MHDSDLDEVLTISESTAITGRITDIVDELPSGKFSRLYYVRSGVTDCPDNDNGYIDIYKANNSWIAIKVITLSGKVYTKAKSHGVWNDWKAVITNSDIMAETVSLQFSAGACIDNGGINANNCISMTATQKYNEIAKNVTLTAQLTSSGYAIYARNANDGSVYNGKLDLYIIARK